MCSSMLVTLGLGNYKFNLNSIFTKNLTFLDSDESLIQDFNQENQHLFD